MESECPEQIIIGSDQLVTVNQLADIVEGMLG